MAKSITSFDRLLRRISVDPKVMVGKPVIRGTRIPVELIVKMLAQGISDDEILQEYPRLKAEDIKAAVKSHFNFKISSSGSPVISAIREI